jgi:hypothetical protein
LTLLVISRVGLPGHAFLVRWLWLPLSGKVARNGRKLKDWRLRD